MMSRRVGVTMGRRISSPELIGRDAELARLAALLDEAHSGVATTVLLAADAGVGKTRLVEALAARADDAGARRLIGRCIDLGDSAMPFLPVVDAFRELARTEEPSQLPRLLGPARRELGRIVPGLVDGPAVVDDGGSNRGRIASAVLDALDRLSRQRPLLVVLEDVHWADRATLGLLDVLARGLRDAPVLILATLRLDELDRHHPLRTQLGELARLPTVERLDLAPFDRSEVTAQIASILGHEPDPGLADEIATRSGGNAFFVEELLAAHEGHGSAPALTPALRDVVAARLGRLPDITREVLTQVAVAGPRVGDALLEAVTGCDAASLAERLRPAVDHRVLLIDVQGGYGFRHALVQEVVLAELLPGERAALHRHLAETLDRRPDLAAGGRDEAPAQLAHHWHAAGVPDRTRSASLAAAERAWGLGAFADALRHRERALAVWDDAPPDPDGPTRAQVLQAAAKDAHLAGEAARAVAWWRAVLEHLDPDAAAETEADLRSRLARALLDSGDAEQALVESRRAHDLVADGEASRAKAATLAVYAGLLMTVVHEEPTRAVSIARAAVEAAREIDDRVAEARVQQILGIALGWMGALDEGAEELWRALELSREIGHDQTTMNAYVALASLLYRQDVERGQHRLVDLADDILAWLDAGGDRLPRSVSVLEWPAYGYLLVGAWERVDEVLERMTGYHLEGMSRVSLLLVRAILRWMRGDTASARVDIDDIHALGMPGRLHHDLFPLHAEVAADDGDLDEVRRVVETHLELEVDASEQFMKLGTLRPLVRAEIDAALGAPGDTQATEHLARANATLERMQDLLDAFPPVPGTAQLELADTYLLLARAEVTRATGSDPDLWAEAEARCAYAYWRCYAAWRRVEAGLASGRDDALEELTATHQWAQRLGATGIRAAVEDLAGRSGVRLPGVTVHDATDLGLTPREGEVLCLVARGHTNREVGALLHISEKTVSVHLSNVFAKLDVENRKDATALAQELGLVEAPAPSS
jgi:DNA-binding CsgD family transcriptional regulator/tetratricopeptide (TPR) repeat protein